jgi:hypothetical protein
MSQTASTRRHALRTAIAMAASAALVVGLFGVGRADHLPDMPEVPRVAFVARNDVPFDSLAIGPVAGAVGGIVLITSPASLSDSARQALVDFNPDIVVIAGGMAAISVAVEAQIDAAGPWSVVRKAGAGRDQTAAALASVLTDFQVGRPALSGVRQVVGDVNVGGRLHADALAVEQNSLVANLNADLLDGLHAAAFWQKAELVDAATLAGLAPDAFARRMWAVVDVDGTLVRGVNVATTHRQHTGSYRIEFTEPITGCAWIATAGPPGNGTYPPAVFITVIGSGLSDSRLFVNPRDATGTLVDAAFHVAILC